MRSGILSAFLVILSTAHAVSAGPRSGPASRLDRYLAPPTGAASSRGRSWVVCELAGGKSYEELLEQYVFGPAGMTRPCTPARG
jgi:hypothetical protein